MFRSFIVSTIALMWSLPSATLLVPVTVPLVYSVIALVAVPPVGMMRSGVALNCASADVERLLGVVLQHLVDDLHHRLLGQVVQLLRVGHRVAVLGDAHRALRDGEVRLRHRVGFQDRSTLGRDVAENVPVEGVTLLLTLHGGVLHVGELAELHQRLDRHSEELRTASR
jgi:hypothetical protein